MIRIQVSGEGYLYVRELPRELWSKTNVKQGFEVYKLIYRDCGGVSHFEMAR